MHICAQLNCRGGVYAKRTGNCWPVFGYGLFEEGQYASPDLASFLLVNHTEAQMKSYESVCENIFKKFLIRLGGVLTYPIW
ncbi:hypothetical protein QR680_007031 [Steinernema hermaphroditum]|uniref:Uncharacterized protein n=1 Tax=Steinernema hermaphroditum TaxID=289476 RepID=A0AA39HXA7_9BILA|nr:hypothetical protein QR680_007031 [Steinernema hermaphroditum]